MNRNGLWGLPVVGMTLVLATTACSSDDAGAEFPSTGVFASTPDSTFPLVEGTSVRMELGEGRMSVSAGCNTLMGSYSVSDGTLSVPMLASTRIGCPDDLADQDRRLEQLLTSAPKILTVPLGFTITAGDSTTLEMTQISASPSTS